MRRVFPFLLAAFIPVLLLTVGALLMAFSGRVGIAASESHNGLVTWFLETARQRTLTRRAATVDVPDLSAPARAARGEAVYRRLCAACHGAPRDGADASGDTPLAGGLNPPPPDLSNGIPARDAAKAWWVTSHGIRMTGMPSFQEILTEEEMWDVVAWLVDSRRHAGARRSDPPPGE